MTPTRPALYLVRPREPATEAPPQISFCGHCGSRGENDAAAQAQTRVCSTCEMGLMLQSDADAAPKPGDAFMVIDSSLAVCALSAAAERLLAVRETDAVNRHVTELVVPADAEAAGAHNLAVAITWAARGDGEMRKVVVRPANTFGVRTGARIASCGPPNAALVVFD